MSKKIEMYRSTLDELAFWLGQAIEQIDVPLVRAHGDLFSNMLFDQAVALKLKLAKKSLIMLYHGQTSIKILLSNTQIMVVMRMLLNVPISPDLQHVLSIFRVISATLNLDLNLKLLC